MTDAVAGGQPNSNTILSKAFEGAERLSKSVLGTLALFLLLIYFIAGGTLVWATLTELNQTILVLFVAFFPIMILLVFFRLVTKHFGKVVNPESITREVYEKIILSAIEMDARAQGATHGDPEAISRQVRRDIVLGMESVALEQKDELEKILNWYTPEWRQKRYLFRKAAEQFPDQGEVVFSDARVARDIVDVFRFIDHIGMSIDAGSLDNEKVPVDFKKSAVRYARRGMRWLKWLRDTKNDQTRYSYFQKITDQWKEELRTS